MKTVVKDSDVRMRVNLRTQNNLWSWHEVEVGPAYLVNDLHPGYRMMCGKRIGTDDRDLYLLFEGSGGSLPGDYRLKMMIGYDGLRKTIDVPVFRVVQLCADLDAYEYRLEDETDSLVLTEDGLEIFIEQPTFNLEVITF